MYVGTSMLSTYYYIHAYMDNIDLWYVYSALYTVVTPCMYKYI